jgi:hypothetical protein
MQGLLPIYRERGRRRRIRVSKGKKKQDHQGNKQCGVYGKYLVSKADGSPVDPQACYFVLRLDTDKAARCAMQLYADMCGDPQLKSDIVECLDNLSNPPQCTCAGRGSPFGVSCAVHDAIWQHVWRHGDPHSFPETQRRMLRQYAINLSGEDKEKRR